MAYDASQYHNDGSLMNVPAVSWSTDCVEGTCLQFDGTNGYVTVPNSPSLQIAQAITMEAWVYWNGVFLGHHKGWDEPFSFKLDRALLHTDKPNHVAVRVFDGAGAGGIYKMVFLAEIK